MIVYPINLSPDLQKLVDQVQAEMIDYQDRDADIGQLNGWIGKGDHSLVKFTAENIIKRQQHTRHVQQQGLPDDLQKLVDQVQAEAVDYKDRDADIRQLDGWLAKGDHNLVKFTAGNIIKRQQQTRHVQQHGLPADLQKLVDQVQAEAIDYKDRDADILQLDGWLAKGDHSLVKFTAGNIIKRQQQTRHVQQHGLPADLQKLVNQVQAEAIGYEDRDADIRQLADWLARGDFSLVEFTAEKIIERQVSKRAWTATRDE